MSLLVAQGADIRQVDARWGAVSVRARVSERVASWVIRVIACDAMIGWRFKHQCHLNGAIKVDAGVTATRHEHGGAGALFFTVESERDLTASAFLLPLKTL